MIDVDVRPARQGVLEMSSPDLRLLLVFLTVADEKNITRAAGRLYMTQQTLSRQIRHLERTLGVDLFVRTTRGVDLTPAGEALAASAADLLTGVQTELDALVSKVLAAGCPVPLPRCGCGG